ERPGDVDLSPPVPDRASAPQQVLRPGACPHPLAPGGLARHRSRDRRSLQGELPAARAVSAGPVAGMSEAICGSGSARISLTLINGDPPRRGLRGYGVMPQAPRPSATPPAIQRFANAV